MPGCTATSTYQYRFSSQQKFFIVVVHLLPLGIAADKSGSRVSHFLNASSVAAWALVGLEPPAVLMHLSLSDWQRGDVLCLLFPFIYH